MDKLTKSESLEYEAGRRLPRPMVCKVISVTRTHGQRQGTRSILKKSKRDKGRVSLTGNASL